MPSASCLPLAKPIYAFGALDYSEVLGELSDCNLHCRARQRGFDVLYMTNVTGIFRSTGKEMGHVT